MPPWDSSSLARGHAGTALLFNELAHGDRSNLAIARHHLKAAALSTAERRNGAGHKSHDGSGAGLYAGMAGLAFAAAATRRTAGDCTSIIRFCDDAVLPLAQQTALMMEKSPSMLSYAHYDLVNGVTGTARYLLRTRGPDDPEVHGLLTALVRLTLTKRHRSGDLPGAGDLPGWLARRNPGLPAPPRGNDDGLGLDLGLSHGIAGPLALLSLAALQGAKVDGMDEAIDRGADWLLTWFGRGAHAGNWPSCVFADEERGARTAASGDRGAWCYGTPGIALSLLHAGKARGRAEWIERAVFALRGFLLPPKDGKGQTHHLGFCHGMAGTLRVAQLLSAEDPSGAIGAAVHGLVEKIIDAYDPTAPFRFLCHAGTDSLAPHDPSLLTGSTGIALALLAYGNNGHTHTGWDQAFLVS